MDNTISSFHDSLLHKPLLTTKLYSPRVRDNLVDRPHLIELLNETLSLCPWFTLISAPAGYGKTTLVADWLKHAGSPFTWINIDKSDNDPARFSTYLVAALQKIFEKIGLITKSILKTPQQIPVELLASSLVSEISLAPQPFTLVLDDYHLIKNGFIHEIVHFLLEHQPPPLNLLILTREDPPFPLARMRIQNRMLEIRIKDLRFSIEEIKSFFKITMRLDLRDEVLETLNSRTEGWVASLQLAALSIKEGDPDEIADFIKEFNGNNRYVVDYFVEEVLQNKADDVRDFLFKTSILERLCAGLCDAVTDRTDSRKVLAELEHDNFFLIPMDEQQKWYRYHPLFSNFLRTRGFEYQNAELYKKATSWFEANDLILEAVKHTLLSKDDVEAERLIKKGAITLLQNGNYMTLLNWLNSVSEETVQKSSELSVLKAWALFLAGQIEEAEAYIAELEIDFSEQENIINKSRLLSLKAWLADSMGEVIVSELVSQALLPIEEEVPFFKILNLLPLGHAKYHLGCTPESTKIFTEAYQLSRRLGNHFIAMCALHRLAFNLIEQGRRREAEKICRQVITQCVDRYGRPLPVIGMAYIPLAAACYAANNLARAQDYAIKGIEYCRRFKFEYFLLENGESILAKIKLAFGETEEALSIIGGRYHDELRVTGARLADKFANVKAEIALKQGNREAALRWARSRHFAYSDKPIIKCELEYFTYARLLLLQDNLKEAEILLNNLAGSAEEGERYGRLITIRILQSLTQRAKGCDKKAFLFLEQAVRLAVPEDYRRPFLDEGKKVDQLLAEVRQTAPKFVEQILSDFKRSQAEDYATTLFKPISRREQEVLQLISNGLSNNEIAEKLFISLGTVKWHINNIFRKLGVNSRIKAIIRAKELKLL